MPKYAVAQPTFPCGIDGCGRPALSPRTRLCRKHYFQRWRSRNPDYMAIWKAMNPDKVAAYRDRENAKRKRGRDAP